MSSRLTLLSYYTGENVKRQMTVSLILVLGLILSACAADEVATDATESTDATTTDHTEEEEAHEIWFGEPGDPAAADMVIDIVADDDFSFSPSAVSVTAGETVTFRVENVGKVPHDFTLGDSEMQDDHEAEMAGGEMHAGGDPNAMLLAPGETGEMTWTFTESGEILIGCHVPGHYAAGMKASLTIDA